MHGELLVGGDIHQLVTLVRDGSVNRYNVRTSVWCTILTAVGVEIVKRIQGIVTSSSQFAQVGRQQHSFVPRVLPPVARCRTHQRRYRKIRQPLRSTTPSIRTTQRTLLLHCSNNTNKYNSIIRFFLYSVCTGH